MSNPSQLIGSGPSSVSRAPRPVAAKGRVPLTLLALGLVAAFIAASIAVGPAGARARGGQDDHRTANLTFTKWAAAPETILGRPTTRPGILMDSLVGRDAGPAGFTGEVLTGEITFRPGFWLGYARYELHVPAFTFIADVGLANSDPSLPIAATIRGVVTEGWFDGARVTGEYTQLDRCPVPRPIMMTGTTCWRVTLHLLAEDSTRGVA